MIKTIIIDDQEHCIENLLELTIKHKDTFDVLGTYQTVQEGVKATQLLQPELVFLDVEIHDETGFDYLNIILNNNKQINFDIVFVTGYDKYALKAIKYSTLDYLLKPIDADEFNDVVIKLHDKQNKKNLQKQVETLIHNISTNFTKEKITVSNGNIVSPIYLKDILYLKADGNYTDIHLVNGNKVTSSKTLRVFDNEISQSNFCRVHGSYLVNMKYIKSYTRGKGGFITMINNRAINVSENKKSEFLRRFYDK